MQILILVHLAINRWRPMSQTSFFGIFKSRNNTSNGTFYKEALYDTMNHNVQKHQWNVSTFTIYPPFWKLKYWILKIHNLQLPKDTYLDSASFLYALMTDMWKLIHIGFWPSLLKLHKVCIMWQGFSKTETPILMKLGMHFRHVPRKVYVKFQLILPINKKFLLISQKKRRPEAAITCEYLKENKKKSSHDAVSKICKLTLQEKFSSSLSQKSSHYFQKSSHYFQFVLEKSYRNGFECFPYGKMWRCHQNSFLFFSFLSFFFLLMFTW